MRKLRRIFSSIGTWLASGERSVELLTLGGILIAVDLLAWDVHLHYVDRFITWELEPGQSIFLSFVLPFFAKYYVLLLACLIPGFIAALWRHRRGSVLKPMILASLALLIAWLPYEIFVVYPSVGLSQLGEEPAIVSYWIKVCLVALLIISPPLLAARYNRWNTFDRYTVRCFLVPFVFCFLGFLAIWLIIDLSDNGPDMMDGEIRAIDVIKFYGAQLPQVTVLIMPVALLLALLYALGKMSRSNELISMLGVGRSMMSILAPLILLGFYATFVCLVFNFEWAPKAEGQKSTLLETLRKGFQHRYFAVNHLHRNILDQRTWFIGAIPYDLTQHKLRNLEIRQQDANGHLSASTFADEGYWDWETGEWTLLGTHVYHYRQDGVPEKVDHFQSLSLKDWRETPWSIVSSSFKPEFLGVPGLSSYLHTNSDHPDAKLAPFRTHWHYRWALPFGCIVSVLVAAPLGIVYSRRGVLGGVASCIFIFFAMLFLNGLFLALGLGNRVPPYFAAWITNAIFAAIGVVLLIIRARNRNFPSLRLLRFRRPPAHARSPAPAPSTQVP